MPAVDRAPTEATGAGRVPIATNDAAQVIDRSATGAGRAVRWALAVEAQVVRGRIGDVVLVVPTARRA